MKQLYGKQVSYGHALISIFQLVMAITIMLIFNNKPVTLCLLLGASVSIFFFGYTTSHDHRERLREILRERVEP